MTDRSASDRCAQMRRSLEQLEREEIELEAQTQKLLATFEARSAELSQAQAEAARKDVIASAASTRAHLQAVRGDLARRLAIMESRASGNAPADPREERRLELQDMLEDLKLAEQRHEEDAERRRAQILAMSPALANPGVDFEAAIASMAADLDAAMVQHRSHFDAMSAEIERELAELS